MFSRFFSKVFCADASNQRGSGAVPPPSPLEAAAKPPSAGDDQLSDDMRPTSPYSAVKKNVGTMEELHKKCKGEIGRRKALRAPFLRTQH